MTLQQHKKVVSQLISILFGIVKNPYFIINFTGSGKKSDIICCSIYEQVRGWGDYEPT